MNCGTCQHWGGQRVMPKDAETDADGQCTRYPPQAGGVVMHNGLRGPQPLIVWGAPSTMRNQWCGEWKEAQVPS